MCKCKNFITVINCFTSQKPLHESISVNLDVSITIFRLCACLRVMETHLQSCFLLFRELDLKYIMCDCMPRWQQLAIDVKPSEAIRRIIVVVICVRVHTRVWECVLIAGRCTWAWERERKRGELRRQWLNERERGSRLVQLLSVECLRERELPALPSSPPPPPPPPSKPPRSHLDHTRPEHP